MKQKKVLKMLGAVALFTVFQPIETLAKPTPIRISMKSQDWNLEYAKNMAPHPKATSPRSWEFRFPQYGNGYVAYLLQNVFEGSILGDSIFADIRVTSTGTPEFEYKIGSNPCVSPAHVRFYIEKVFNNQSFVRWWATGDNAIELKPGVYRYRVALDPKEWSDTWGHNGNSSAAARRGFHQTLRNPSRIGFTFGGGCFYGHGVAVSGGTAHFEVTRFGISH